jgi:hypothetical protein
MVEYLINTKEANPDEQAEYVESTRAKHDNFEKMKGIQALTDMYLAAFDGYIEHGEATPHCEFCDHFQSGPETICPFYSWSNTSD